MPHKKLYKITFINHGKSYELYARHVASSALWGFTEVGELLFDTAGGVVVDTAEECLREEFGNTHKLHLPMQSVVRIEEVKKREPAHIRDAEDAAKVTPLPLRTSD